MIPFYLIANMGSLMHVPAVQTYPRHLVLAQVVGKNSALLRVLKHMQQQYATRIILDNGAYEGEMVTDDDLLFISSRLKPAVLVLPDLPGENAALSRERSFAFADRVRDLNTSWSSKVDLMYVPQGTTPQENCEEYMLAMHTLDPRKYILGFGLSYKLWRMEGDTVYSESPRKQLVAAVFKNTRARDWRFHLLGARWDGTQAYAAFPNIVGIDTYKPTTCALNKTKYGPAEGLQKYPHASAALLDPAHLKGNLESFAKQWNAYIGSQTNPHPSRIKSMY